MSIADDFRRSYEQLSDDQLIAVRPPDASSEASAYWCAEAGRRGLEQGSGGDLPHRSRVDESGEEFVPLDDFREAGQALLAQSMLDSARIPARFLTAQGLSDKPRYHWINDALGHGRGTYVLAVPASMVDLARNALHSEVSEADLEAQALAAGPPPDDADPQFG
jgi:hypothetical protein